MWQRGWGRPLRTMCLEKAYLKMLFLGKKCYLNVFKKYLFIFERERESECARMSGGGAEREGERKSQAGFALSAQTLTRGSIS